MVNKRFHLGDVLSVTTGRLVAPDGMAGIYGILNFMTADDLFTHQLPRAMDECRPWLLRQYPFLGSPEMDAEERRLAALLQTAAGEQGVRAIIKSWLAALVKRYGKTLPVEPIPRDDHEHKDPVTELEEMIGKDKVIVVAPSGPDRPA